MSLVNETTTAVLNSLTTTSQDQIVNLTTTSAASSVAETVTSSTVHFTGELSTTVIVNHQSTVASSLADHATDAISTAVSRGIVTTVATTATLDDAPVDWLTVAILLGVVIASIIVAVIVVALVLYLMRRRNLRRRRTIKRVENPIYRQSGNAGHYSLHLGDSPTISLSNNNRLKNPELWASKDIKPQQQSAAAQNRSDDRKPMLNAPAPFATGDDLETHDLFNQDHDQSTENLNVDLAEYAVVKKDGQPNRRLTANDDDAKPSDRLLPASQSTDDDTAKVSTFAR